MNELSRRHFVSATAGVAGALAIGSLGAAPASAAPAAARPATWTWSGPRSANGWEILREARQFHVEGSDQGVRLAAGDTATILLHVARRFHYEIDRLRDGDLHGHRTSRRVGARYESNYLSGTAVEIRPLAYPLGVKGGLYPAQLTVVRDILAELEGVVAWGGDFTVPKESHFEIAYAPGHREVTRIARTITGWNTGPGNAGAGATDAFDPGRQARARSFARRHAARS
ncbi:M15 family metallopeptidase [Streptantibioticus cattleyicolor]|uniref:Peptidase M15C domain-containing protein n=1 Tax=Streptantibioticus cattleyicolor (strain ATCC 35852 / DSM 46488 / JCM 4925 / NBRC 14057 / NRRL 8057) TaxID=1003195 RepID=F8JN27_STREN|nr:M15 family metallopeptidase [Streptantibioticus cattleyicolor]AEW99224.1 hypothetical protein SCATT_p10310 [Streptantibioticus cattleyicolor NRRL 8057 = DSM 46488]CCB71735.1 conserved exported protein of unknown function [Streptantibioticus cattleyicolor NRRL 8057 = DSM 46488]